MVLAWRRVVEPCHSETVVCLRERVLRLVHQLGVELRVASQIHRADVVAGPGQFLLFFKVQGKHIILWSERVSAACLFAGAAEAFLHGVPVGAWGRCVPTLLEDLLNVDLLHVVATHTEGVANFLAEGVSVAVVLSWTVDTFAATRRIAVEPL